MSIYNVSSNATKTVDSVVDTNDQASKDGSAPSRQIIHPRANSNLVTSIVYNCTVNGATIATICNPG